MHIRQLALIAALSACGRSSNTSSDDDWTKLKTKHYEGSSKGVSFSVDAPDDRMPKPGDPKLSARDFFFMNELGKAPTVAITIMSDNGPPDSNVYVRMAKEGNHLVKLETFENGYAFTTNDKPDEYVSAVVVYLASGQSVQCEAMGGGSYVDKHAKEKLPALEAICRTLDVGGVKPKITTAAAPAATTAVAAGDLPAECTAYLDLMAKLASCDKLAENKRDGMKFAADHAKASWDKLPADRRGSLAAECKAGADGLAADRKACGL